jgi:hypothetical protein
MADARPLYKSIAYSTEQAYSAVLRLRRRRRKAILTTTRDKTALHLVERKEWYAEARAWYGWVCIGAAAMFVATPALLSFSGWQAKRHPAGHTITVALCVVAVTAIGIALLLIPAESNTRIDFEQSRLQSIARGIVSGAGLGWTGIVLLEQYWFQTFRLPAYALEVVLYAIGIAIAVRFWHPTQKRILKSYYRTARLYRRPVRE